MNRLHPQDLAGFLRKYRFTGGRVRAARVTHKGKEAAVEFRLLVREASRDLGTDAKPVRLVLRLVGVDEFRLQMRPGQPKVRIADARVAYLNSLFYVNLDAWALEPGEQPKVFDFRASEVFAAGRELWWDAPVSRESKTSE